jgi:hypothetical protein
MIGQFFHTAALVISLPHAAYPSAGFHFKVLKGGIGIVFTVWLDILIISHIFPPVGTVFAEKSRAV